MTDEQLHDGRMAVADLDRPPELPPEIADEIADADLPEPDAPDPLAPRRREAGGRLISAVFRIFGLAGGLRLPSRARVLVRQIWRIPPDELAQLAEAAGELIPERFLLSRVVRAVGVAAGIGVLVDALEARATDTIRIRQEVARVHNPAPVAGPAPDAGARRADPRRDGRGAAAPVGPVPRRTPGMPDGFTGAGLGLGEAERSDPLADRPAE